MDPVIINAIKVTVYLALDQNEPHPKDVGAVVAALAMNGYTVPDESPGSRGPFTPHACIVDQSIVKIDAVACKEVEA